MVRVGANLLVTEHVQLRFILLLKSRDIQTKRLAYVERNGQLLPENGKEQRSQTLLQ